MQLLSAYYREKGGLAPPQVYELSRLLNFLSAEDLLGFVSRRGRERVERWFPIPAVCTDCPVSLMPGEFVHHCTLLVKRFVFNVVSLFIIGLFGETFFCF